ncbi:MAG: nuclear transport factor 2 family protein [Deltaproteobacteria bacterium]|nr:nuclear transport factor 2 family protein [Deltaproteobacteria bacterium]
MSHTHSYLDTITRYYHGCNTAEVALVKSTFTDDVVHYFTQHEPIRGAEALATYWVKMPPLAPPSLKSHREPFFLVVFLVDEGGARRSILTGGIEEVAGHILAGLQSDVSA